MRRLPPSSAPLVTKTRGGWRRCGQPTPRTQGLASIATRTIRSPTSSRATIAMRRKRLLQRGGRTGAPSVINPIKILLRHEQAGGRVAPIVTSLRLPPSSRALIATSVNRVTSRTRSHRPTCTDCHKSIPSQGLHSSTGHRKCTACHDAHTASKPEREKCVECHQDRRTHMPDVQRCNTCHIFR